MNQALKAILDSPLFYKIVLLHNDLGTLRILSNGILYALGIDVLVLSGFRLANWGVEVWVHAASIICGVLLGSMMSAQTNRPTLSNVLVWFGLAIPCFFLAWALLDTSWDGTGYHLPSVIFLSENKNPIIDKSLFEGLSLYTHGVYMWQWSISAIFGSFQVAKITHAILIFVALAGLVEITALLKGDRINLVEIIFCYVIVLNPVVTSQLFTFYLDSPLYLVSLILLSQLVLNGSLKAPKNPLGLF